MGADQEPAFGTLSYPHRRGDPKSITTGQRAAGMIGLGRNMSGRGHFRGLERHSTRLVGSLGGSDGLWRRPARIVDLSLGGARLETDADVPTGASVRLSVESPNRWDPLEVPARVASAHERDGVSELGLCFEPSSAAIRGLIDLLTVDAYE